MFSRGHSVQPYLRLHKCGMLLYHDHILYATAVCRRGRKHNACHKDSTAAFVNTDDQMPFFSEGHLTDTYTTQYTSNIRDDLKANNYSHLDIQYQ